jgi:hypothetical protein
MDCRETASATELTSIANEYGLHQHQQHDIQNLQNSFQDLYWGPSPNLHHHQQDNHQEPQEPAMPKVQSNENGRLLRGGLGLPHSVLPAPTPYEDQENGNLSWLLDFKLDSLIEAPEDKSAVLLPRDVQGISL